ncbi:hypothetical protein TKK_0010406 [Trichogramma kaykai]
MKFPIIIYFAILGCLVSQALCQDDVASRDGFFSNLLEVSKQKIAEAKSNFDNIINKGFETVKNNLEKLDELTDKVELVETASKVEDLIQSYLEDVLFELEDELAQLEDKSEKEGVDVSDCSKMINFVRQSAIQFAMEANQCVSKKLQDAQNVSDKLKKDSHDTLGELMAVVNDANDCTKNINSITSVPSAIACLTKNEAKATWIVLKKVPSVISNFAKVSSLLITTPPSISYCVSKNGFSQLKEHADKVIKSLNKCHKQTYRYRIADK